MRWWDRRCILKESENERQEHGMKAVVGPEVEAQAAVGGAHLDGDLGGGGGVAGSRVVGEGGETHRREILTGCDELDSLLRVLFSLDVRMLHSS